MKRSDIPDEHVLDLARRFRLDPYEQPGVVQALVDEGVPEKLAVAKVLHMCKRGLMEYGTSPYYAWPCEAYVRVRPFEDLIAEGLARLRATKLHASQDRVYDQR